MDPILITALLPVVILIYYIYRKDKNSPEPTKEIIKAFLLGVLSAPLSFLISVPFRWLNLYPSEICNVWDSIRIAFFGAAIPEEITKFAMLWFVLRNNKYFDEKMDGIVYAACVSLGFAALENVLYLFSNADSYMTVGITRAIFSVPGHFCFGILMGYFYSLAKFYPQSRKRNQSLILIAPIVVHGIYDTILFSINVSPAMGGVLIVGFLVFCWQMWKWGSRSIQNHLRRDGIINN